MNGWIEEYLILRKLIEKYCEEQDKNRLISLGYIDLLYWSHLFLIKYKL